MTRPDDITIRPDFSALVSPSPRQRASEERRASKHLDPRRGGGRVGRAVRRRAARRLAAQSKIKALRYLRFLRFGVGAVAAAAADFVLDDETIQRIADGVFGELPRRAQAARHARSVLASRPDLLTTVAREGSINPQIRGIYERHRQRQLDALNGAATIRGDARFPVANNVELLAEAIANKVRQWVKGTDIPHRVNQAMNRLRAGVPDGQK